MDSRIDAIYGRQSIDKKDSISIESQFEFCRYELKGGEGKEYKDKGYSGKNIERPDFQRLLQDIRLGLIIGVILRKLCQQKGVEIIEARACPDRIHMLISIPPKYSVA